MPIFILRTSVFDSQENLQVSFHYYDEFGPYIGDLHRLSILSKKKKKKKDKVDLYIEIVYGPIYFLVLVKRNSNIFSHSLHLKWSSTFLLTSTIKWMTVEGVRETL